jgi:hypothetical protein
LEEERSSSEHLIKKDKAKEQSLLLSNSDKNNSKHFPFEKEVALQSFAA